MLRIVLCSKGGGELSFLIVCAVSYGFTAPPAGLASPFTSGAVFPLAFAAAPL
jgi:hypothetical protein